PLPHYQQPRDLDVQSSQILLNAWFKFCIQLHSAFHECTIMPGQLLQAEPPSSEFSYGRCDTILIQNNGSNGSFHSSLCSSSPSCVSATALPIEAPALDQPQSRTQRSSIIPLTYITHGVELIPVYDTLLPKEVNSSNSLEIFNEYFLNNFADKELYHTLAVAFGV
ncbi:hypothetical protein BDR07DRAFT_1537127, partial [Suillus spraguei]